MKDTNYNFPVSLEEISTQGNLIPGRKAVVRGDTGQTLGIVSDRYQIIPHKEVIDTFRSVVGENTAERVVLTNNGGSLFATYKLDDIQVEVAPGDSVALQLIVKNSYNGSSPVQVMLGAYRMVCSNGMIIGKSFFNYSQRHTGNANLNSDILKMQLDVLIENFRNSLPAMKRMSSTLVSTPSSTLFDSKKLGIPYYLVEEAMKQTDGQEQMTQWDYYNALTSAITHSMKSESPQAAIDYGQKAWKVAQNA